MNKKTDRERAVGTQRVLAALAETIPRLPMVDLVGAKDRAPEPAAAGGGMNDDRYIERGLLGRGGLGEVVEAFDQDLRRSIALKRPRREQLNESGISALIREAQITAQLDHPNIPSVYSLGIDAAGCPFFTMTRLRGITLAELLDARRTDTALRNELTTQRLLRILLQVGSAVAFAHAHGVLHRDLKPENILVGDFGEVRLMDWGIAKVMGRPREAGPDDEPPAEFLRSRTGSPGETLPGTFVGTPGYAAPEQVEGRPDIDRRADIYALGALLYKMISGRAPIVGDSIQEVILATRQGKVAPLQSLTPVSRGLAAVTHKALALRPEERYQDVPAFLADIEALFEGRSVAALDECVVRRAHRWYWSRSPRMARLRNVDVDLLCWASSTIGIPVGAALVHYAPRAATPLVWLCFPLALLLAALPFHTLFRKSRPDDPGGVLAFSEGVPLSHRSRQILVATAPTESPATRPAAKG